MTDAILTWLVRGFFSAIQRDPSARHLRWKWFIRVLVGLETWAHNNTGLDDRFHSPKHVLSKLGASACPRILRITGCCWNVLSEFLWILDGAEAANDGQSDESHPKMCFKRHGFSVYFRLRRLVNDLFEILDRDLYIYIYLYMYIYHDWGRWREIYHDSWWNLRTIMHHWIKITIHDNPGCWIALQ